MTSGYLMDYNDLNRGGFFKVENFQIRIDFFFSSYNKITGFA